MDTLTIPELAAESKPIPRRRNTESSPEYATRVLRPLRRLDTERAAIYCTLNPNAERGTDAYIGNPYTARRIGRSPLMWAALAIRDHDTATRAAIQPIGYKTTTDDTVHYTDTQARDDGRGDRHTVELPARGELTVRPYVGPTWQSLTDIFQQTPREGTERVPATTITPWEYDDTTKHDRPFLALTADNGGRVVVDRRRFAWAAATPGVTNATISGGGVVKLHGDDGTVLAVVMPYRHAGFWHDWAAFTITPPATV